MLIFPSGIQIHSPATLKLKRQSLMGKCISTAHFPPWDSLTGRVLPCRAATLTAVSKTRWESGRCTNENQTTRNQHSFRSCCVLACAKLEAEDAYGDFEGRRSRPNRHPRR